MSGEGEGGERSHRMMEAEAAEMQPQARERHRKRAVAGRTLPQTLGSVAL